VAYFINLEGCSERKERRRFELQTTIVEFVVSFSALEFVFCKRDVHGLVGKPAVQRQLARTRSR
jgi:hypothetical protein